MKCDAKQLLLFAAASLLVTALSREIGLSHAMGASIDYACGLYLAVLVCSGSACWWRWTAVAFAAEIVAVALFQGDLQPTALLYALAHVAGVLAAAWLIRRTRGLPFHFNTMSDVLALLAFAAVPGAVVSAGAELALQAWHGRQVTGTAWVLAWEGYVLGMILVAPAVLAARQSRDEWPRMNALRWAEAVTAVMVLVLVVTLVFNSPLPMVYLVLPLVLWVGLRFGMSGMALALLLMSAMVLHYTGAGMGMFASAARTPVEGQLLAQSFLVVGSASALLLAALAGQWRRTQDMLRRSHGALEALVSARTTALQDSEQSLRDNEARFRIARDAAKMIVVDWDIPRDEMTFSDSPEWLRGPLPASGKYPLFKDQVHADDRAYFLETQQRGIDTLEGQTVQFRIVRTDGVVLHILSYQTMFSGPEGKAAHMVAVHQDISGRRQIEVALTEYQRQLAASEARYRTLFENNPLMYFTLDGSGFMVSVNPQGATQLGYRVDELVGRPVTVVFPAAVHHQVRALLRQCMNEPDRAHTWEITKLRKDGAAMHVRESAVAVRDADGVPLLLVMCENVTEHKQAEMALRESEQRLRTLLDAMPDLVRLKDARGRYVMLNRAAREHIGLPMEQIIGKTSHDILPTEVATKIDDEERRVFASGESIRFEHPAYIVPNAWRELIFSPIRDADGAVNGLVSIDRDITARKRAKIALRESEQRLLTLLDAIPDRVRLRDVEGRYVMVNRAARESIGMPTSQIIGKTVFDVRPPAVAALLDAEARMAIAADAPIRRERKSIMDTSWREVIMPASRTYSTLMLFFLMMSAKRALCALR